MIGAPSPGRGWEFFQIGSCGHPASYLMGTRSPFPGGKAAGE